MAGDIKKGEKIFKARGQQCHTLQQGVHGLGPSLFGLFGRRVASEPDYNYSSAMQVNNSQIWTEEMLYAFLENPKKFMPGTKMSFEGLKRIEEREHLIAYLKSVIGEASESIDNPAMSI